MTGLTWTKTKYNIAAKLQSTSVEIVPVKDDIGFQINVLLRQVLVCAEDNPDLFTALIGAMRALHWRLLTDIQPPRCNKRVLDAVNATTDEAKRLFGVVGHEMQNIFDSIQDTCNLIRNVDSVIGTALLTSIRELGEDSCIVVVGNVASKIGIDEWLHSLNMHVEAYTVGELMRLEREVEQVYVVGPPAFFVSSIISSPVSYQISFLIPDWYKNTELPVSPIGKCSEKPFIVKTVIHPFEGDSSAESRKVLAGSTFAEKDLLPKPHWPTIELDRQPQNDEVFARRVLLSRNFFCLLDDGERIRAFDPDQPVEDRLINIPVISVTPGTYLLLRKDQNKQGTLYEEALDTFGLEKQKIIKSQQRWKKALSKKLSDDGKQVENSLKSMGVQAANRVEEWVDMAHILPQKDSDFQVLLQFLGIEQQPTFDYAKRLRNTCQQLGCKMRKALETELSRITAADLQKVRQNGYFEQQSENPLYRSLIIIRVLAVSPNREIVSRQKTRIPFEDKMNSAKWLE